MADSRNKFRYLGIDITDNLPLNPPSKPPSSSNNGGSSSYYELPRDCNTLQDVIYKQGMTWNQANIFKAAYRWDKKPDLEYNLNKIIWFAKDELDRLYAKDPDNPRSENYGNGQTRD